ncbi:MAG TPA: DUF3892 domain-containing protein [Acidimicrobiales bacterium]
MGQIGFASGFAFQSSFGGDDYDLGNYEVFIPWRDGGFAHWWYDGRGRWHGPALFGSGTAISVAVFESNWRTFDNDHGNFELLALVRDGGSTHLVQWYRDNDDPFTWQFHERVPGSDGYVALAFGRRRWSYEEDWLGELELTEEKEHLYGFGAKHDSGLRMHDRDRSDITWDNGSSMLQLGPQDTEFGTGGAPITNRYVGLGWVFGTVGGRYPEWDMAEGAQALIATRSDGALEYIQHVHLGVTTPQRRWYGSDRIGTGASGRPCLIQSNRGYESGGWGSPGRHGNYEAFVPSEDGGILHFWRDNNPPRGWNRAPNIGTERYDEVSAFQDRRYEAIRVFAWQRGEKWLHYFRQHKSGGVFVWPREPEVIGVRPAAPKPPPQRWTITCTEKGVRYGRPWHVHAVGGVRNGVAWRMTAAEVVAEIRAGRKEFVTVGATGSLAKVIVVDRLDGRPLKRWFITTSADGSRDNNLLQLPSCPHP